jgi:hypothetical protein
MTGSVSIQMLKDNALDVVGRRATVGLSNGSSMVGTIKEVLDDKIVLDIGSMDYVVVQWVNLHPVD